MHLLISNIAQVILLLIALAFKDDDNHSVFPLYSPSQPDNLIISSARPQTRRTPGGDHVPPTARPLRWRVYPRTHHRQIHLWILHGFSMSRRIRLHRIRLGQRRFWVRLQGWNPSCDIVFRARSTTYSTLSFLLLVTALEVKHFSQPLFNLDPTSKHSGPFSIFPTAWRNRFLFWTVLTGFTITFPIVYIPVVNRQAFKHSSIT